MTTHLSVTQLTYRPRGAHEAAVLAAARVPGGTTWDALRDAANARRWPARANAVQRLLDLGVLVETGDRL